MAYGSTESAATDSSRDGIAFDSVVSALAAG